MNEVVTRGSTEPTADADLEMLVFTLGSEEYGLDILKVQEIRGCGAVTRIPTAPAFIRGLVNLRGSIVPVVDLRVRFDIGERADDESTVMIVLNLSERTVGMIVDGVSDVVALGSDQIRPAPEFEGEFGTDYITGLGVVEERMLILMDIERLMLSKDMALTADAA